MKDALYQILMTSTPIARIEHGLWAAVLVSVVTFYTSKVCFVLRDISIAYGVRNLLGRLLADDLDGSPFDAARRAANAFMEFALDLASPVVGLKEAGCFALDGFLVTFMLPVVWGVAAALGAPVPSCGLLIILSVVLTMLLWHAQGFSFLTYSRLDPDGDASQRLGLDPDGDASQRLDDLS